MIDTTAQRALLSRYPTGVTVVCTMTDAGPIGITVNSFASVSLDPPLVLWSIGKASDRYEAFRSAKAFTINILNADQADLAQYYAQNSMLIDGQWEIAGNGAPRISGAAGTLECCQHAVHPGGDHDILVGEVTALHQGPAAASLTFFKSGYGRIG
ncbi:MULTISPECIES: flavin reductase family protein [Hyphobacterium]|uniref:Flavin reductase family protein n=1 Tax=Hyphobacterium vulgare TaxID=1736751 RepID=A0ABV6ZTF6_9PROT